MKLNKFLLTITLCAGLQFNAYAAEQPEMPITEQSYWQMYAPQFAQDTAAATSAYVASWIPQSVKDRVNSWSTRKKIAVASAIIGSLAAIYNRDQIMYIVKNAIQPEPWIDRTKSNFYSSEQVDSILFGISEHIHALSPKKLWDIIDRAKYFALEETGPDHDGAIKLLLELSGNKELQKKYPQDTKDIINTLEKCGVGMGDILNKVMQNK